jgi:small conductance mechanosensitive channel
LTTPQNLEVVVPNGQMWGSTIVNYSQHDTRRLDITFGIDYADDPDKAAQVITDMVEADGRGLADPAPWVRVVELNESSVDLQLRVWCKSSDYHEFKFALLKSVKAGFDDAGISIPYPHQVEIQRAS